MSAPENHPAFPQNEFNAYTADRSGMTLHDWFAGQALSNPAICTGKASEWELTYWFGKLRTGITTSEIVAKQAATYADAMLAERAKGGAE